jgi:hypothetical protein
MEDQKESLKRRHDSLPLLSPVGTKHIKVEDAPEMNKASSTPVTDTSCASGTTCGDALRGNITIIHVQPNGKHPGSRMQWTFPKSYLAARTRSTTPQSPAIGIGVDTELYTSKLSGTFTPEAIAVFYQAVVTESSVQSHSHSLHEYCQIQALAQNFGIYNIFRDGEGTLLRIVMGDETSLETVRAACSLASIFRWRALVERCRLLLQRRVRLVEMDLKTMNCGGLNILATKLDEVYDFMVKSGFVQETRNGAEMK